MSTILPIINKTELPQVEKKTLQEAAKQFEAIFLHTVLKTAREASESFNSGFFHENSDAIYNDMLDQELANHLAHSKWSGLSEKIVETFSTKNINHSALPTKAGDDD